MRQMFVKIINSGGRVMAKAKIYAVKKGRKKGIFKTWEECKQVVTGYPGAEYKGFYTEKEANDYLMGVDNPSEENLTSKLETSIPNQVVAYVDGSYDQKIGRYSFGCILILPSGDTIKELGNGNEPESLALRNVAGEMLGAMYAVKWCIKNEYSAIKVCYDYSGIEAWATGEWKAKNALTKKYADFMQENATKIVISFEKIQAHTGDYYNEEADKLAKRALTEGKGIPKIKKGDYWLTVEDISWEDLNTILDLVQEEMDATNTVLERADKDIAYGKSISLKLRNKDRVAVNHYNKGNKLVMQGKPKRLFSAILSYVTELVEVEKIPEIFNNTYKIDIDKEEICSEFQFYMPNAYDKLPEKLSRTLHQAVYNLKLNGDMFDGTFLAQPVIRAIEAHLKMLLLKYEIIPNNQYIKINGFDMFDKNGAKYKLTANRYGKATLETVKYIGDCYTFYHSNRHQLSHWDDPMAPLDTTKLLDVNKAHDLIKRTLALIDQFYEVV